MPPTGWNRYCRETDSDCQNTAQNTSRGTYTWHTDLFMVQEQSMLVPVISLSLWWSFIVWFFSLIVISRHHSECASSLLAQVSGHITAFEAFKVIEALGQPLGSLAVRSASIGQSVGAATFQTLQTAQITVFWIRQHVCEAGITAREEDMRTHACAQVNETNTYPLFKPDHLEKDGRNDNFRNICSSTTMQTKVKGGLDDFIWYWPSFHLTKGLFCNGLLQSLPEQVYLRPLTTNTVWIVP